MILRKTFRFEASHRLPFHPGKCSRLHGHSWVRDVEVEGPVLQPTGMVMDFADLSKALQPIIDDLDHHHLGTWDLLGVEEQDFVVWRVDWLPRDFNSTCENLLFEIGKRLEAKLKRWHSLTLHETCTSAAVLTRPEFIRLALEKGE